MADRNQIVLTITQRIHEIMPSASGEGLTVDDDLRNFAEFDSLVILETLVWLENEFGVTIPDEDLEVDRLSSIGKMADYVIERR